MMNDHSLVCISPNKFVIFYSFFILSVNNVILYLIILNEDVREMNIYYLIATNFYKSLFGWLERVVVKLDFDFPSIMGQDSNDKLIKQSLKKTIIISLVGLWHTTEVLHLMFS
jgi:hypothetical protein